MEEKSAEFVQILWAAGAAGRPCAGQSRAGPFDRGRQIQQRHWVAVLAAQSTISCAQLLESDGNRRVMQQVAGLDHAATSRSKFISIA
jgi:hypothetical protein